MRLSPLPLVLAGLLGSAALAPEAAKAYPYGDQRYGDQRYAYGDSATPTTTTVRPEAEPMPPCPWVPMATPSPLSLSSIALLP